MIQDIVVTLGLGGLAMAALAYIARHIVLHVFTRDLAAHKAELDRQVQRHAHELDCLRQQFQIQFSKTYEQQVDAIRQLYDGIGKIRKEIGSTEITIKIPKLFKQSPKADELKQALQGVSKARQAVREFKEEIDIFLPASLSKRIDAYLDSTDIPLDVPPWRLGNLTESQIDEWQHLWSERQSEADRIADELKTEFRRLQGIDALGQQDG